LEKAVKRFVQGNNAIDGAGVKLVRVLGLRTVKDYDPFLMLDSFDSHNPSDYIAGFPMHPHRGIETITYLVEGEIDHQDSLGNKGKIESGGMQWMTAGSGILHQEMPQPKNRILGLQLWLNLPSKDKMTNPKYFDIDQSMVKIINEEFATIRVVSGNYRGIEGVKPNHIQATIFDVTVKKGQEIFLPTISNQTCFIFTLLGKVLIDGQTYQEKSAILFGEGDGIRLSASSENDLQFMFVQAEPLHESIAWGGPIVMNTEEELEQAFKDLRRGTFIK
jgi:redox-sensitive bicupin YhaK (pirin superfamily)